MDHHHGPITAILAALTRLGEADTKQVAVEAGVAYSTTVKKLRGLAADGRALRRDNGAGAALWRAASTETASTNPARDSVEPLVTALGTAPAATATAERPDRGPEPEAAFPHPDRRSPTTSTDGDAADETDTQPVLDQEAQPHLGEPAQEGKLGDAADDTATPRSAAHPEPEPLASLEADGAAGSGTQPDSLDTALEPDPIEAHASTRPTGSATADAQPTARRGKGRLRDEVLAVLQDNPDTAYKVSQLSKLLGGASQGAITNALHKLVTDGTVTQTVERPATYQAH
jgi:hypothetical protein